MAAAPATLALSAERPLLPDVAAGDETAMSTLMQRFTPLVRTIAWRTGSGGGASDDLVQETMVRLWRFADRFDPERGSEPTFVATVARNAAIDMARRQACRPEVVTDELERITPPAAAASDQVTTAVTLRAALNQLAPERRELLRLAYYERLTQPEISDRLGIPVGTVKSRTFAALRALRAILADDA
jgi:RNA polymerase sigma-70 factor (ECF subfamily)